jgi:hypothetical protein
MTKFVELGFTTMDGFLFVSCIGAAILGSMIDYTIKRENFLEIKTEAELELPFSRYLPLVLGRAFIGAAAGLLVYLLLLGSLSVDKSGYARLMILALISGFAAPAIIKKYESKLPEIVTTAVTESPETANKSSNTDGDKAAAGS